MTPRADRIAEYLEWLSCTRAPRTCEQYGNWLRQFERGWGFPHMATPEEVEAFVFGGQTVATRRSRRDATRSFYRWCVRKGLRKDDPTVGLDDLGVLPRRVPKPVDSDALRKVLDCPEVSQRTKALILLGAYAGLRTIEMSRLEWADVNLLRHSLRVTGKGDVTRTLPLHPEVAAALSVLPHKSFTVFGAAGRGAVSPSSLGARIRAGFKQVEVTASAHQLRHWFATEMLRTTCNLRLVQELLGHASILSTQIYTRVDTEGSYADVAALRAG